MGSLSLLSARKPPKPEAASGRIIFALRSVVNVFWQLYTAAKEISQSHQKSVRNNDNL